MHDAPDVCVCVLCLPSLSLCVCVCVCVCVCLRYYGHGFAYEMNFFVPRYAGLKIIFYPPRTPGAAGLQREVFIGIFPSSKTVITGAVDWPEVVRREGEREERGRGREGGRERERTGERVG